MVEFENPAAFFLLLFIPVLYFLRYVKLLKKVSIPVVLGDWEGEYFEWENATWSFLSVLSRLLESCAFIMVVLAYANPVIRHQEKVYASRGADIMFVVDTSPSMAARDIAGISRIEAAKLAIHTLADNEGGVSLGLVEMAKEAALVVPTTMDRNTFFSRMDALLIGELGDGTAIGTGLSTAVFHLENSKAPKKIIVLITDGENNAGSINPYTAARLVESKGISFYVLGVGSNGSVPLEYTDPKTGKVYSGYFQSDYDGQNLSKLAAAGNGNFFNIDTLNAFSLAFGSLSKNESVVQSYRIKNTDTEYYYVCLIAAGILFSLGWFIKRVMLGEVL